MDPAATLAAIEDLYRRVLEQTLEQERCLQTGELDPLSSLLADKARALAEAQQLTVGFQASDARRDEEPTRQALDRIAGILEEMIEAEDRCRRYVPARPAGPPRAAAASAYGRAGPRR